MFYIGLRLPGRLPRIQEEGIRVQLYSREEEEGMFTNKKISFAQFSVLLLQKHSILNYIHYMSTLNSYFSSLNPAYGV